MKQLLITIALFSITFNASSQGWMGGANTLFGLNSAQQLTPLSVGIGTNAPAAQFHTTGSVRFAGITNNNAHTRVLVTDSLGNLYWRNATTLGSGGGGWSLNGNAGTNPATNFIGTTDLKDLSFKVNNNELMHIYSGAGVSIGTQNVLGPNLWSSFAAGNGNHIDGTKSICLGWNNFSYNHNQYLIGTNNEAHVEYSGCFGVDLNSNANRAFLIGSGANGSNKLINNIANSLMVGFQSGTPTLFVKNNFVGIRTTAPTANFHSVGTARLESLPSGTGNMVLIDASGNLYRGPLPSSASISSLEAEVNQLRAELNALKSKLQIEEAISPNAELYQNEPNPFSKETIIRYLIPANTSSAQCYIFDSTGKMIFNKTLTEKGEGHILFNADELTAGIYIYSLVVDGQLVKSRNLIIAK